MRRREPSPGLDPHPNDLSPAPRPFAHPLRERAAARELHGDEQLAVDDLGVIDADHGRMLDPRHRARLAPQPLLRIRPVAAPGIDMLERNLAAQIIVPRPIHQAHAALPEHLDHLVAVDPGPGHQAIHGGRRSGSGSGRRFPSVARRCGHRRACASTRGFGHRSSLTCDVQARARGNTPMRHDLAPQKTAAPQMTRCQRQQSTDPQ
ncbi:MAG TPA: hypothetical protein VLM79_24390 [Kofleriaceae bacterium]|nr:hypothetical protein [Kofleriaceae bacterium]